MTTWLKASACLAVLLLGALAASAEAMPPGDTDAGKRFARLADEFLREYLALSPVTASSVGYHEHKDAATGAVVRLDEQLDDFSPAGLERQRAFLRAYRARLRDLNLEALDLETRADYELIRDVIELGLLELDRIESHKHKPQLYVETLGAGLFVPLAVEYAPPEKRLADLLGRLERTPAFFAAAKKNLTTTAPVFLETALEENRGNIGLIQGPLQTLVPAAGPLAERYQRAAPAAVAALEDFNRWLDTELRRRATGSWRLGQELYAAKLRYALGTDLTPQQILRDAEQELVRARAAMMERALPLHAEWFPEHGDHADLAGEARENKIIGEVLDRIGRDHARRDQLLAEARRNVADLTAFLLQKKLLTLSGRENLEVIETPPFMRGAYGVGGFWSAPPLEPELGAFYMVTPIPDSWTDEQAESKLREYNRFSFQILSIHETLPGHYVQLEQSNNLQPEWRRLLRSVFGNTPYVEGWGAYAQDLMVEAGYLEGDPRLALVNYKWMLRMIANAILDVRMQTGGMTDQEALDLMINRTFQERAEAEGKLRRAQLTSTQLPSYFLGWREWWRLRRDLEQQQGSRFSLADFHDRALKTGAINQRSLRRLLLR